LIAKYKAIIRFKYSDHFLRNMGIFYRQTLIGKEGKEFTRLKIRTMVEGADSSIEDAVNMHYDCYCKAIDDPRVTRLGRIIRRFWIDEIFQIWNMMKGEMSLVGPRPKTEFDLRYMPEQLKKSYLVYGPGLIPPVYARRKENVVLSFEESCKVLSYCEGQYYRKKAEGNAGDAECIFKVFCNIFLYGVRGR
jgi:lipopolysaccharide/colanic/teichoic acid biosynthesis glycosyltransferase